MAKTKLTISGPAENKDVLLDSKGAIVGRGSNCDVILEDDSVSRHHARIYQDPFGRWIVEDLESRNGVLVDGQRIKAQVISPGQQFGISHFTLSLSEESGQYADTRVCQKWQSAADTTQTRYGWQEGWQQIWECYQEQSACTDQTCL